MHAPAIRPRSAIEIVDAAVSLYRDNFATMAVIGLAASVPFVVMIILGVGMFSSMQNMNAFVTQPLAMVPAVTVFAVVLLLWFAVIDGAMAFAAAEAYHGRSPSPADALRGAFAKGLTLVAGNVLRMLIVFGVASVAAAAIVLLGKTVNGFILFIIWLAMLVLAVNLMARTFAITSVIVIENQTATEAVERSFFLSKDAALRIVGVAMLCLLIYWVTQFIGIMLVQTVVQLVLRNPMVSGVLGNLLGMIVYPFLNIAIMVLYYDQRVRKEGYDLDVMSGAIPTAAPR
jgi:hypothetical protein